MVAAHDGSMDFCTLHRIAKRGRYHEVIDSPPDVSRPRIGKMAPPRIVAIALGEQAERIDKAGVDEGLKSRALLIRESLLAAIGFRVREVQLRVRDIEIAAKYDGFGFLQLLAIGEKCRIPMLVPQRQPAQVVLGIGSIDGDHKKLGELRRDNPAFLRAVALQFVGEAEALGEFVWKTIDDVQRLVPRENRHSRIA